MTNYEGFDWGFDITGTPLGGVSSRSMPGPKALEFVGSPREQAASQRRGFTEHVERVYEKVNPHNAGLWDPRGRQALTMQPADYIEGSSGNLQAKLKDFEGEADAILNSATPREAFSLGRPNTNVNFELLRGEASGLSPQTAEVMGKMLEQYDPGIVETIAVPRDISQKAEFVDESGYIHKMASNPDIEAEMMFARTASERKRPIRRVDQNGVVDKYTPGTGPYDAPGLTRPGGMAGAAPGTMFRGAGDARVKASAVRSQHSPMPLPTNDELVEQQVAARDSIQQGSEVVDYEPQQQASAGKNTTVGKVIGGIGFGLAAVIGVGMLIKGAQ